MNLDEILPKIRELPESEQMELLRLVNKLEEAKKLDEAKNRFLPFVKETWPGFIHGRHHEIMGEAFEKVIFGNCKRLIINMPPRHPLEVSTPVLTTTGWTTMGEVKVGDFVFGPDGKPTEVIGKSEVYKDRQLFSVMTDDGAEVVCDGDHRWRVRLTRGRGYHVYTTEQLWRREQGANLRTLRNGMVEVAYREGGYLPRAAMLPEFAAVDLPAADLPVDPYVLGVWLGDGTALQAIITMKDEDAAPVRAEIERRGYVTTNQSTPMSFGILKLKVLLRDIGVLGNKHIPSVYFQSSIDQRTDLLRGLMDTDGNVSKDGQCFFAQKSAEFCYSVRRLLWSLGVKNTLHVSRAKIGDKDYGDTYKVSFYLKDCAFLPRKSRRTINPCRGRFIRVKKLERCGETVCIKVARQDESFLVGHGMLVTLNTKSEFASYLLPAWFMGNFPDKKIIQATHTAELAVNFGRKVRNLINSDEFQKIFPGVKLQSDSKASGRWGTDKGGEYFAVGVGGAIAGKGADLFIIDDPHTEQEAILAAHDPSIYDKAFDWYSSGPRQRLQPDARIVIVMCMTGDTPVLLADGTERLLRDIRPGDEVATYEQGSITTAKVNNWQSSGVDDVFTIQTKSGKVLRANERHPFLVDFAGNRQWVKLKDLKPGYMLVATKAACDPQGLNASQECALPVNQPLLIAAKIQEPLPSQLETTASGRERFASAANQLFLAGFVQNAITKHIYQKKHQSRHESTASKTDMESPLNNTIQWLFRVKTAAMYAGSTLLQKTRALIGMANYASTIATKPARSEDCFATTAISQLDTAKNQKHLNAPLHTYDVFLDEIVSIKASGTEEVFDVEIDRTENFIANGVVSHNTRWGKRDLTGRLIQTSMERGDGETEWEVIELPAIMPSGNSLWPQFWKIEALEALKAELPAHKWNAQYQQQPTNAEGAILKREWWKRWPASRPPSCEYIIVSADTAFTKNNRSDYTAFTVWGVFEQPNDSGSMGQNLILLDAFKERMEFPELKQRSLEVYKEWEPDTLMIEGKASGLPLIHELRQLGIPVSEFTPTRASGDKIMRANSISDMFASGIVWAPETRWADEVIEECASFPNGAHDDYVDAVIMALMRYRQGGFIRLPSDYDDEPEIPYRAEYY